MSNSSNDKSHVCLDDIRTNESRTIKPLKPCEPCTLPIVAVMPDRSVVSEITGQRLTFDEYCEQLRHMPRHLVVTFSSDSWLWQLNERWKDHPRWTWCVCVHRKPRTKMRQYVSYYGFRPPRGRSKRQAFANPVLDASSFTQEPDADLIAVGRWVIDFCNTYGIKVRASAAGVSAQLLRHPMFYPEARRAVPKFINDTARKHLPGPFYERYYDARQQIEAAMYIDQEAAYHFAALTTPLPDANSTRATGYTRSGGIYARPGGRLYEREMQKHGLVYAAILAPPLTPEMEKFVPRALRVPGMRRVWLWTNEIPYLESLGMRILHLISVWGTEEVDEGIRRYAQWAYELSRENPHLKALLLMPYGSLGRRPGKMTIHTPGGDEELLLAGRWIEGTRTRPVNVQTYTANALQLGLIQSHVRALSLDMARQLAAKGSEVISIYADGIFLRLDEKKQIPMFAPWRLKEDHLELHLTDSLRVPVRAHVKRDYLASYTTDTEGIA